MTKTPKCITCQEPIDNPDLLEYYEEYHLDKTKGPFNEDGTPKFCVEHLLEYTKKQLAIFTEVFEDVFGEFRGE